MKKLPISIQTFAKIRQDDFLYIDKTEMVWNLTQKTGAYFLSRPRRFGKSLLIDTFKSLFEGRKELFEGLYIEEKWDWSKTYPVIRLDFTNGAIRSLTELEEWLYQQFEENQKRLGLDFKPSRNQGIHLLELIQKAHEKYAQKVIVLVDEYDKPILDNIEAPEVAAEIRESLKNVYSILKGQDACLQFVFVSGVTKFSKVSLFSGMNQLHDITLHKNYASLCGYTQRDLETSFAPHLQGVDPEGLKTWYNGYSFWGEKVYNPFDILLFIDNGQLYRNYWFETGSPSFLLKLFQKRQYFLPDLEEIRVSEEILDSFEIENINPITILFQTGYLTIEKVQTRRSRLVFTLKIPNQEVRLALYDQLIDTYTARPAEERLPVQDQLAHALETGNLEQLRTRILALFASIPWRNFTTSEKNGAPLYESEGYYASVLYAFFSSIHTTLVIPEDISNKGQADLTVILGNYIYVMEIKRDTSKIYDEKQPNPALKQILERNYAKKYVAHQKEGFTIIQIGLVFHTKTRNLVAFDSKAFED